MEKYKSMQQLDSEMRLCSPQCFCDGSCKKPRKSLAQKLDENELQRFTEVYDRGIGVLPHERGEYVKLEDIIAFESEISAKKKIETVEELISSTPNDQELGEKVREMFR